MKQELVQTPNGELEIQQRIRAIRGVQVMLDRDLAELYGVSVSALNQAVSRNSERFPDNFMFRVKKGEIAQLITDCDKLAKIRYWPEYVNVFTEQGIAMLSAVLRSETAIQVSIQIINVFVALRHTYSSLAGVLQRLGTIEVKQIEADKKFDTIFDALDRSKLLPCGILPANSEYDSIRMVSRLITQAKSELLIIDPYADATLLDILSEKAPGVTVRLVCKDRGKPTASEIAKFNKQYKGLTVSYSDDFHDRFVIVDNAELHNFGSSVNCLGRRLTTYTTRDAREIKKLLSQLP